ncbi:hypothetical protein [Ammoniphilus sp. CFH 90114]|uniref:DUF6979 family protein n=1 Tax=Ammoniphilus sp. CFH 90114 TaxID=2493665 RepID=UPI00100F40A2|nr:hypothetical protein [Ammoniphilus sp. CFH 90114]RXT00973.1 hypothetical protein EIZ39_25775 [Ammoniphilus sp. CFH 90114]
MGSYGKAAGRAVQYLHSNQYTPREAWNRATIELFGEGTSRQQKGCPRGAFLGLCEEGLIKGVEQGKYSHSLKNKHYAVMAVELLKMNMDLINDKKKLWNLVTNESGISQNHQLDVVISLWKEGYINTW